MKIKLNKTALAAGFGSAFLLFGSGRLEHPVVFGSVSDRVERNFLRASLNINRAVRKARDEQKSKAR